MPAHAYSGALKTLNPQMNSRGGVKDRPRPASVAEPTISPDSLLEGDGFRTIGPWRHAVGSVMENVDNLAEPAGRLSQSATLRGCYVPALVKGSMAWLVCLPVGQALPWRRATARRFFSFGEGPTVRIRFPPAESLQTVGSSAVEVWRKGPVTARSSRGSG